MAAKFSYTGMLFRVFLLASVLFIGYRALGVPERESAHASRVGREMGDLRMKLVNDVHVEQLGITYYEWWREARYPACAARAKEEYSSDPDNRKGFMGRHRSEGQYIELRCTYEAIFYPAMEVNIDPDQIEYHVNELRSAEYSAFYAEEIGIILGGILGLYIVIFLVPVWIISGRLTLYPK